VFDRFYNYDENVPAAEYDAVLSYFKSVMNTTEQAENFTTAIFRVAQESGENAITILQQFYGLTGSQLTLSLCYYLNSTRSNATLLGMLQPTAPNYWTSRNVRQ
jgi:hypothetical protein